MKDGADVVPLRQKPKTTVDSVREKFEKGEIDDKSRLILFYSAAGDNGDLRWLTTNLSAIEAVGILEILKTMIFQEEGITGG